jgi:hypothetical protein
MRRIVLALAAVAAFGLALPVVASTPSDAREVVVIKKKHHRDYGWHRGHVKKKIVIREGRRHHHRHGATVVVR